MADDTLGTLVRVSRPRPPERRLVCGRCRGEVKLTGGELVCQTEGCGTRYGSLRELALVEAGRTA